MHMRNRNSCITSVPQFIGEPGTGGGTEVSHNGYISYAWSVVASFHSPKRVRRCLKSSSTASSSPASSTPVTRQTVRQTGSVTRVTRHRDGAHRSALRVPNRRILHLIHPSKQSRPRARGPAEAERDRGRETQRQTETERGRERQRDHTRDAKLEMELLTPP